jgi:hypothetical protein
MLARTDEIEKALLQFEGAIFCIRDVLARILIHMPPVEADTMIQRLADRAITCSDQLGTERLKGYIDELQMLRSELRECNVPENQRRKHFVK